MLEITDTEVATNACPFIACGPTDSFVPSGTISSVTGRNRNPKHDEFIPRSDSRPTQIAVPDLFAVGPGVLLQAIRSAFPGILTVEK